MTGPVRHESELSQTYLFWFFTKTLPALGLIRPVMFLMQWIRASSTVMTPGET